MAAPVDRPLAVARRELAAPAAGDDAALVDARARRGAPRSPRSSDRVEAARQAALAPRLGIVPTLDLRGTYRWTNEAGLSGREEDWNVGLTLGWSICDGGDRSALAAQRDADCREAELALAERKRRVALEVEQALADLATADAAFAQSEVRSTPRARTPRRCASATAPASPPRSSRPTPPSPSSRPRPSRPARATCAR